MFNFNLTHTSNDQRLHVQLTASYTYEFSDLPGNDPTGAINMAPDAPALFNADGSLNWQPLNGGSTFNNPLAYTLLSSRAKIDNLISELNLSYRILPGLQLETKFGFRHTLNNQSNISPDIAEPPPVNTYPSFRTNNFATTNLSNWIMEPQLNYEKNISKGKLNVILGSTFSQNIVNGSGFSTSGYPSDALINDPQAASTRSPIGYFNTLYHYDAAFGRIGYTWENKYLINATGRRDGSSRFGPDKQFGNFGAIGAGWIFSQEKFAQNALSFLSFGKLRGSYGTSGNDQIPDYEFLSTYSPNGIYQGITGLNPTNLTNPNLAWELNKKLEGGIELGFLKDRISLTASVYRNRSGNQLVPYRLPAVAGFGFVYANLPAVVQNTGKEFTLRTTNVKSKSFSWVSSFNLSIPRNKLLAFPNLSTSPYSYSYVVGQSLFISKRWHFAGINDSTGTFQYATSHGLSDQPSLADLKVLQPLTNHWYGGIENSFSYKGFDFSFLIYIVDQTGYNYMASAGYNVGTFNTNYPTAVNNRWRKPGDKALYGFASTYHNSDPNYASGFSDFGLGNTSFIRLQSLALSYHLPKGWLKKLQLQNARFYIHCENLFVITHNYLGFDPGTGGTGLPPLRTLTGGLQITL